MKPLADTIALVAGATRGAGRAIAVELALAGATVIATGRSSRNAPSEIGRLETIEETVDLIHEQGGVAEARVVDHTVPEAVGALIDHIRATYGKLDILINDIWGGDHLLMFDLPFHEQDITANLRMLTLGLHTHIITSHAAIPLMLEGGKGIIVEMTDGITDSFRGNICYDLTKASVNRFARTQAEAYADLIPIAVSPGFLRSEAMLDYFGVTEATWRDGAKNDPHFIASETPYYVARCVAALCADPNVGQRRGTAVASWNLAKEYDIVDVDGRRPDWRTYAMETLGIDAG